MAHIAEFVGFWLADLKARHLIGLYAHNALVDFARDGFDGRFMRLTVVRAFVENAANGSNGDQNCCGNEKLK